MRNKSYDIVSKHFMGSIYENLLLESTRVILHDDSIITSSEGTEKYNFYDFYEDYCKNEYFDKLDVPHIISTGMGTLYNLEKIEYGKDLIEYLNSKGLHIYLQEALIVHFGEKKRIVFKEDQMIDDDQIFLSSVKSFFTTPDDPSLMYSFEFESIIKFASKNQLKNVTVFVNESEVGNILGKNYPSLKFSTFNNWSMTYKNDSIDSIDSKMIDSDKIQKKMLALSLRYEPHKHLINAYLINDDDNEISWYENRREWDGNDSPDLKYLNDQVSFDLLSWKEKYPEVWKKIDNGNRLLADRSPIILQGEDSLINENKKIPCGTGLKLPISYHARSFCYIVNETKYGQPFGYFSEKTINSIACCRPFVIVAPPNSLKYLSDLGFQTFDRWWDESYDQETDHEKRLLKIFEVIDFIQGKSIEELKSIWKEMQKILDHNKKQIEIARKECKIING